MRYLEILDRPPALALSLLESISRSCHQSLHEPILTAVFEDATWKLHNRRLSESIEQLGAATGVQTSRLPQLANGDVCGLDEPDRGKTLAGAACYLALNHLLYAPVGNFVQSVWEKAEPTRRAQKEEAKGIKKVFKAYNVLGGARAAVFLAMSATSSAQAMAETDPEAMTNAPYFEELYGWLEDFFASRLLNDEEMDLLFALNVTRNSDFLVWDTECVTQGATEPSDPSFVAFHNDIGALLALSLVIATDTETVRATYACSELDGLSQEAIERSQSPRWTEFRTFAVPIHWRNGLAVINELVMNNAEPNL